MNTASELPNSSEMLLNWLGFFTYFWDRRNRTCLEPRASGCCYDVTRPFRPSRPPWAGVLKGNGYVPARDAKSSHYRLTLGALSPRKRRFTQIGHSASGAFGAERHVASQFSEDGAMAQARLFSSRPLGARRFPRSMLWSPGRGRQTHCCACDRR